MRIEGKERDKKGEVKVKVKVKGIIMEKIKKDGKCIYCLYQSGEREIIRVRAEDEIYEQGDEAEFEGRLLMWTNRGKIDFMVMVD